MHADPFIFLVSNVEESRSTYNVTNFLCVVDVLFKESLNLLFVSGQMIGVYSDDVSVTVSTVVANLAQFGIKGILLVDEAMDC